MSSIGFSAGMWVMLAIVGVGVAQPTTVAGERRRRRSGLSVFGLSTGVLASTGEY